MSFACNREKVSAIVVLVIGCLKGIEADEGYLYCVSETNNVEPSTSFDGFADSIASKPGSQNQRVDHCESTSNACFALWEYKQDEFFNFTPTVLRKGCWKPSDNVECESETCIGRPRLYKAGRQNLTFCCCKGNMCNLSFNYTLEPKEEKSRDVTVSASDPLRGPNLILCIVGAVVVALGIAIAVVMRMLCQRRKKVKSRLSSDSEERHSLMECFDAKDLKILEIIGHGRYGTVWRGIVGVERDIAVKVFNPQSQNYFFNERDIYCLPLMDHPNIVGYLGCDERLGQSEFVEHRIFLNYHPIGCVQDYLRNNAIDWSVFCKMGHSISRGLSHLHTYLKKGDYVKPAIAHRDINSRNILVKSDLSLCICDMGFAMQINGAHYVFSGEQQHAETSSLTDVGTLRYMAPEVLEGAVNLRECEAALKQIDVYALSLVLWELATRCHDLCISSQKVPAYKMPFEAELGPHMDFERLQNLVCRLKARPLFPEFWRDNNQAVRLLRETIEDCWDPDSEARLTAVCVEERFGEMNTLWDRFKAHNSGNEPLKETVITRNSFSESHKCVQIDGVTVHGDTTGSASMTAVDVSVISSQNLTTKEVDKNFNTDYPWLPQIQPYQGKNPCLERNTLNKEDSDDLSVSGNALVSRSVKQAKLSLAASQRNSQSQPQQSSTSDTNNSGAAHRILNPIPYVQNVVIEPKILNVARPEEPEETGNIVSRIFGAFSKKAPSSRNTVEHLSIPNRRNPSGSDTKESVSSERSLQNVCVSSIPSYESSIPSSSAGLPAPPLVVHVPVNDLDRCQEEALPLLEQVVINRSAKAV